MWDLNDIFSAKRWITLATAIVLASGSAQSVSADDDDKDVVVELRGGFDKPLRADEEPEQLEDGAFANVTSVVTHTQNGRSYTVKIHNGKMTVERDGKAVGKDEYRKRDGMIEFLDKQGNVEYTMQLPVFNGPGAARLGVGRRGMLNLDELFWGDRELRLDDQGKARLQDPPPVMLGVTLSNDEDGVRIDSVREGLPADKGGLKAGDIIVRIDKIDVSERADITDYLRTLKDGDKVEVVIDRDGKRMTQTVKLEKWDSTRMGTPLVPGVPGAPDMPGVPGIAPEAWVMGLRSGNGEARAALREARKELERALERLTADRDDAKKQLEEARKSLNSALDQLREAEASIKEARPHMRLFNPGDGRMNLTLPDATLLEKWQEQINKQKFDDQGGRMGDDAASLRKEMEALREEMRKLREDTRRRDDR